MHSQTRANIRLLMARHSLTSERQLAMECNMSQSTLHRFMKEETSQLDFLHLQAIAHRFNLNVSQLIGEAPFDPDPKVRSVVFAMQQMPEYKKDMLVAASSSLVEPKLKRGNGN
jgi:transcriptional regulator with XRE-family HTH domain